MSKLDHHVVRSPVDTLNILGAGGLKAGSIIMAYGAPGCFTGETKIKLLDGTFKTLEELSSNKGSFYVYSYDIKNNKPVPGKARFASKHLAKELVEITLDNGKTLTCTLDHKWLKSSLEYTEAKDLKEGDSIQAARFNTRRGYEYIYCTNKLRLPTHWMVRYEHELDPWNCPKELDCHHKDHNKFNNSPNNLEFLTRAKPHANNISYETLKKTSDGVNKFYKSKKAGGNHKIVSMNFIKKETMVYDISVEGYNNFLIDLGDDSGVYVHNSGKSTFSYQTAALYQKDNPDAVVHIIDSENSVDLNRLKHVFQLDMDRVKIHYTPTLEGAFKVQLDILAQMGKQKVGKYQDGRKQVKILSKKKVFEMEDSELFKYCESFKIPSPDGPGTVLSASNYDNDRDKVLKALALAGGYTMKEFDGPIPTLVIYDTIASSRPQVELDKIAEGNLDKNAAGMNIAAQVISTKLSAVLSYMGGNPFTLLLPNQVRNKSGGFMGGFTEGFAGGWCLEHSCHYILKFTKINNRDSRMKNYDDDAQMKTGTDFFMKIEKTKFCPATGRVDLYINDARGGIIIPKEELATTALNLGIIKKIHGGFEIPGSDFGKMKWTEEEDPENYISSNSNIRNYLLKEVTKHYRASYFTLNLAYKEAGLDDFGKPSEEDINKKINKQDGVFLEESFSNPFI